MLTTQEQDEVIKFVKKIIRNDRNRRSRLAKYLISEKAAREGEKKDYEELRYVLKDLG